MADYPVIIGFDVETTGLYPDREKITEIGAVKVDCRGKVVDTFSKFGHPGKSIDAKITQITGITNEMVKDSPPSDEVIMDWWNWIGEDECILVAHNASFDVSFLTAPITRMNMEVRELPVVCTLNWAKMCFKNTANHKLQTLLEHIDYHPENAHRAYDDAKSALHLAAYMMKTMHKPSKPEEMYECFKSHSKSIKQYLPKKVELAQFNF